MSDPAILEAFDAVIARLTPEGAWIKGDFARASKRSSQSLGADDPKATCWCLMGAIWTAPSYAHVELTNAVVALLPRPPDGKNRITFWNDKRGRTQAQVLALLDRAKAAYEATS